MSDYKELYLKLMRANEKAIRTLIQAQQECEKLYLKMGELSPVIADDSADGLM